MANNSSSAKSSSVMADLLARHKNAFITLKKGETVKAKITKLTPSEILVDAGAKTEAIVLEKDRRINRTILATFKVGETVEVSVLNPESDSGQSVVSLRRYLSKIAWEKLEELQKSKQAIEVTVTDIPRAGYIVATDFGISGFLPQSHVSFSHQDISIGSAISVTVLELNKKDNKIIFSQKPTITEEDFETIVKQLRTDQKVTATVIHVTSFGIFVSVPLPKEIKGMDSIEGFIHISEVSWDKVSDISTITSPGQTVEAVVIKQDKEARRVNLSIKRLTKDPFDQLMQNFPVDKKVTGNVAKVDETGVTITIDDGIEGFIKKEKIPLNTKYTVGQELTLTVSEFDKRRHKIILTPVLLDKPIGYR